MTASIFNGFKWIDQPQKENIDSYKEAVENYIDIVSKHEEVKAVLQIGNVGVAGISDIDLIVFLDDSVKCINNYSLYQIDEKYHHILMHDVFIAPYRLYEDIHFLAPIFDEKIVYKRNPNHKLTTGTKSYLLKFILLNDLIPVIKVEFFNLINQSTRSTKLAIARINALKYPFFLLQDLLKFYNEEIDINDKKLIEEFIKQFANFRSAWFDELQSINLVKLNYFLYEAHFKIVPIIYKYWHRIIPNIVTNSSNQNIVKHNMDNCLNNNPPINFINLYLYSQIDGFVTSNIKFKGNTVDEFIRFGFSEEYNRDLSKRAYLRNTAAEFRAKENISYGGLWHLQIEKKRNISLRDLKINVKKQLAKISKFLIKYA